MQKARDFIPLVFNTLVIASPDFSLFRGNLIAASKVEIATNITDGESENILARMENGNING